MSYSSSNLCGKVSRVTVTSDRVIKISKVYRVISLCLFIPSFVLWFMCQFLPYSFVYLDWMGWLFFPQFQDPDANFIIPQDSIYMNGGRPFQIKTVMGNFIQVESAEAVIARLVPSVFAIIMLFCVLTYCLSKGMENGARRGDTVLVKLWLGVVPLTVIFTMHATRSCLLMWSPVTNAIVLVFYIVIIVVNLCVAYYIKSYLKLM